MRLRSKIAGAALGTAGAVFFAAAPSASAHVAGSPPQLQVIKTVSSAYVGPLQFAVDGKVIYVADSFTSTLNRLERDGYNTIIANGPDPSTGGDIAGVAVDPSHHALAYTSSTGDHSLTTLTIRQPGARPIIANLSKFEAARNPDQRITYGIAQPVDPATTKCIADALAADPEEAPPGAVQGNISYRGIVDSHPYAVASLGHGSWAVADAGGNDILRADARGHISPMAVLLAPAGPDHPRFRRRQRSELRPERASTSPGGFEAVLTDVEVGPDHAVRDDAARRPWRLRQSRQRVPNLPVGREAPEDRDRVQRSDQPRNRSRGWHLRRRAWRRNDIQGRARRAGSGLVFARCGRRRMG